MERQIAYDKPAREDHLVRMRAREIAESKVSQGLTLFPEEEIARLIKTTQRSQVS